MNVRKVLVDTARLPQVGIVRTTIGSARPSQKHEHTLYGTTIARTLLFDMKTGGLSENALKHPFVLGHGLRVIPTFATDEVRTKAQKALADTVKQLGFPVTELKDIIVGHNGEKILYASGNSEPHHHIILTNHAGVAAAEALAQLIRKTQTANHVRKLTIQLVTHDDL